MYTNPIKMPVRSEQSSRHGLPAASRAHLRLVADSSQAAVVDEGEHALAVVARDKLHRDTDAVYVCVTRATRHLII